MRRLKPFKDANPNGNWEDWVNAAHMSRVSLSATGEKSDMFTMLIRILMKIAICLYFLFL